MAARDLLDELKKLDFNELEFDNIGSWPMAAKLLVWIFIFVLCIGGGWYLRIDQKLTKLDTVQKEEQALRQEFEKKAFKAANLKALRRQMEEIEESFGALLGQLPTDTEVPGLLEDITDKAVANGLEISSIKLLGERETEFYVELPISIMVRGSYHDLAGFVSGIAGLSRIVTLHDYAINGAPNANSLTMSIQAKTYRYKDLEAE